MFADFISGLESVMATGDLLGVESMMVDMFGVTRNCRRW